MADMIFPGTAAPADVLTGKKFSAGTNYDTDGSMANQGSPTFTPSGSAQGLPAGYYSGGTINGVSTKSQAGSVSNSSSTTGFILNGSSVQEHYISIPVPSGATKILRVLVYDAPVSADIWAASPDGYADGQNSGTLFFWPVSSRFNSGGSLSISTSGIVLPTNYSSAATYYYVVFYI